MRIRLAVPADGPRLAAIYETAVVGSTLSVELAAPDGAEMSRRITETLAHRPWVVAETDSVLGFAYASQHRVRPAYAWSVEVTIYTAADSHRKGLGRALYSSLFALLSLQGYQNAYAGITESNASSIRFHEAMGFELVGTYRRVAFKLGRWIDVGWYVRNLGSHPAEPAAPRLLPAVWQSPEFESALQAGLAVRRPPGAAPT